MGSLEGKKLVVEEIKERFKNAQSVVVADYRGLTVSQATDLRTKLRNENVELKVYKNTMVKRAVDDLGLQGLDEYLQGPTAWAFSLQDPVSGPKILRDFAKKNEKLVIKGGLLEQSTIDADGIKALADLPPREVLLAQVVGAMQGPLAGLVNVLQGPIRKLGYAVEDLRKQKAGA